MSNEKKLTKAEYWEWRTSITEWKCAEVALENSKLKSALMEKDAEIARLKIGLFSHTLEPLKDKVNMLKEEYLSYKKKLEDRLGMSLNGCVIDEVTYEIRVLEEDSNKKEK